MIIIRLRGPGVPASSSASRRSIASGLTVAMAVTGTPPRACGYARARRPKVQVQSSTAHGYTAALHSSTHPEGWRDWPYETPATSRKGTVPIPSGSNYKAWEMWKGPFHGLRPTDPGGGFSDMPPESLRCKECQTSYPLEALYVCELCFGPLEVDYHSRTGADPEELKRRIQTGPYSLWRYSDFLPVRPPREGLLPAGFTPLLRVDRLAETLGLENVWIKNDAANPTHSFKDRVVSIALARARGLGFEAIAGASTGNLANAVAAHAAAAGLESYVFIPSDLEEQKVLATGVYGTNLVSVRGTYDDVNRLCTELSSERDWAFVNINVRPYYAEGSKTLAFEIAEQLGFELPDRIVAPVASGSLFTKIARGFAEWIDVGLLDGDLPTFNGAQAEG